MGAGGKWLGGAAAAIVNGSNLTLSGNTVHDCSTSPSALAPGDGLWGGAVAFDADCRVLVTDATFTSCSMDGLADTSTLAGGAIGGGGGNASLTIASSNFTNCSLVTRNGQVLGGAVAVGTDSISTISGPTLFASCSVHSTGTAYWDLAGAIYYYNGCSAIISSTSFIDCEIEIRAPSGPAITGGYSVGGATCAVSAATLVGSDSMRCAVPASPLAYNPLVPSTDVSLWLTLNGAQ